MVKRLVIAIVAVFVLWTVLDMVIHAVLLAKSYEATKHLWRTMEDMQSKMWLMHLGVLVGAITFVSIYGLLVGNKSPRTGLVYGALYGLGVGFGMGFGTWTVMPITATIAVAWFAGTVVECLLGGLVAGAIVKDAAPPVPQS